MKKSIIFLLLVLSTCFAGKIHIHFNDETPTVDINYNELRYIEFCDSALVFVKGGEFEMGDHFNEASSNERPVHSVVLSDFHIGKTEVTWKDWRTVMDTFVGIGNQVGDDYPVRNVSWYETIVYCNKRSIMEGLVPCYTIKGSINPADWGESPTASDSDWDAVICNWNAEGYRLPTEAEWEYAARGGGQNSDNFRFSGCHEESDLTNYAWYSANSGSYLQQVATRLPNQLGLYDMSGNVEELCWDWYGPDYYTACDNLGTVSDPHGPPDTGYGRINKGGAYHGGAFYCRVSYRTSVDPSYNRNYIGLRIVRSH